MQHQTTKYHLIIAVLISILYNGTMAEHIGTSYHYIMNELT